MSMSRPISIRTSSSLPRASKEEESRRTEDSSFGSVDMMTMAMRQPPKPPAPTVLVKSMEESRKSRRLRFRSRGLSESTKVRFSTVTFREYPIVIGDNPGAPSGPALSIDWIHGSEQTLSVKEFEEKRPPRRSGRAMICPSGVRFDRLRMAGFSRAEILAATKPVNICRTQRRRTYDTLQMQHMHVFQEKLTRNAWNLLTLGGAKQKEKKYLASHVPAAAASSSKPSRRMSAPFVLEQQHRKTFSTAAPSSDPLTTVSLGASSATSASAHSDWDDEDDGTEVEC